MSDIKRKKGQQKNRNQAARDAQLETIAKMTRRGYTQYQIAQQVGVSIATVVYDQKIIKARWRERQVDEYDDLVKEKLEQLREVRREAWEAWERSKEDWYREVEEHGPSGDEEDKGDAEVSIVLLRRIITKAGRLPENAYLMTIMKTIEQECRLTGLGVDVDKDGNKPAVVVIDWNTATVRAGEPRKVKAVDEDPVARRLAEVEALPDPPGKNGQAHPNRGK
jgi:hypothetical protein